MSNKIISNKYLLLTATILSAMMLAASPMPSSLLPTAAFAAPDNGDIAVEPTVQTDVPTGVNVNVDPDVIFSEDCEDIDAAEETEQVNDQPVRQEDNDNTDVGDGGIVAEPTVQTAVLTGVNVNVDTDVFIVWQCEDGTVDIDSSDETEQVNDQPAEQEAVSDSEVGEGGALISPDTQTVQETALNHNEDNEYLIVIPS
jgi:hypothetical protein